MAEGMMNPNTQEQLMLVQSFEQLANAVGAEIPVSIDSEMAAVKNGMRMSEDLQRILAEGSMQFMNQLRPDQIGDMSQGTGTNPDASNMGATSDSEMQMMQDSLSRLGLAPMTDAEMRRDMDIGVPYDSENPPAPMTGADMRRDMDIGVPYEGDRKSKMRRQGKIMLDAPTQMMPDTPRPRMAPDTGRVMSLQEAIDAGFVTPTRPQARPTAPMQSMRPQARPMR